MGVCQTPTYLHVPSPHGSKVSLARWAVQEAHQLGYEGVVIPIGTDEIQDPTKTDWSGFTQTVNDALANGLHVHLRLLQNVPVLAYQNGAPMGPSVWVTRYNKGVSWQKPFRPPLSVCPYIAQLIWQPATDILYKSCLAHNLNPTKYASEELANEPGIGGAGGPYAGSSFETASWPAGAEGTIEPYFWTMLRSLRYSFTARGIPTYAVTLEGEAGSVGQTELNCVVGADAERVSQGCTGWGFNRYATVPSSNPEYAASTWTLRANAQITRMRLNPLIGNKPLFLTEFGMQNSASLMPSFGFQPPTGAPLHQQLAQTPGTIQNAMFQIDGQIPWQSQSDRQAVLSYLFDLGTNHGNLSTPQITQQQLQNTLNSLQKPNGINQFRHWYQSFQQQQPDPRSQPLPPTPWDNNPITPGSAQPPSNRKQDVANINTLIQKIHNAQGSLVGKPASEQASGRQYIQQLQQQLSGAYMAIGYNSDSTPIRVGSDQYNAMIQKAADLKRKADILLARNPDDVNGKHMLYQSQQIMSPILGTVPPAATYMVTQDMRDAYRQWLQQQVEKPYRDMTMQQKWGSQVPDNLDGNIPPAAIRTGWWFEGPQGVPQSILSSPDPEKAVANYPMTDQEVAQWAQAHQNDLTDEGNQNFGSFFGEHTDILAPVEHAIGGLAAHATDTLGSLVNGSPSGWFTNDPEARDAQKSAITHVLQIVGATVDPETIGGILDSTDILKHGAFALSLVQDPIGTVNQYKDQIADLVTSPFNRNLPPSQRVAKAIDLLGSVYDVAHSAQENGEDMGDESVAKILEQQYHFSSDEAAMGAKAFSPSPQPDQYIRAWDNRRWTA